MIMSSVSTVLGEASIKNYNRSSSSTEKFKNFDEELINGKQIDSFRDVRPLTVGSSSIVIAYDAQDNITVAAAKMFGLFLDGEIDYELIPLYSLEEQVYVIEHITENQIMIHLIHGLEDSYRIDHDYWPWEKLNEIIHNSKGKYHVLASCFSAVLDDDEKYHISGLSKILDYELAVPALLIPVIEYYYEIHNFQAINLAQRIQTYFDYNDDLIFNRVLNPQNILSAGENMTLHYRLTALDTLKEFIKDIANGLSDKIAPLAANILAPIFEFIPEDLADMIPGLSELNELRELYIDFEADIEELVSEGFTGVAGEFEPIMLTKKVETPIGEFIFKIQIVNYLFLDGSTEFDFRATTIRFGFEYEKDFAKGLMLGPLPVVLNLSLGGCFFQEFMLEYFCSDPSWNSLTDGADVNPETWGHVDATETDPLLAQSLVGYVNVPGPFEDLNVEAWFGIPSLGISKAYRAFGSFGITLTATSTVDIVELFLKAGHIDLPKKADKWLDDHFDGGITFATTHLYAIFTGANDGIQITFCGQLELGITLDLKLETKYLDFEFCGGIKLIDRIVATIIWDQQGIYLHSCEITYPWVWIGIELEIKLKIKIGWIQKTFTFGADFNYTYYFGGGGDSPNPWYSDTWTYDESPIHIKFSVDYLFLALIAIMPFNILVLDTMTQIYDLAGTLTVEHGSAADQTPPMATFITPSVKSDPVHEAESNIPPPSYYDPSGDYYLVRDYDPVNDEFTTEIDLKDIETIDKDLTNSGALALQVNGSMPIPLIGDDASIRIYAFDKHDTINTDSVIDEVKVHAEFTKADIGLGMDVVLNSNGEYYMFKPFNIKTKLRLFFSATINDRKIDFINDQGKVFCSIAAMYFPRTFTGFTEWSYTSYIKVKITDFTVDDPHFISGEGEDTWNPQPTGQINLKYGEVILMQDWSTEFSDENGGIFRDEDSVVSNGPGEGIATGLIGYGAYYDLELPLHRLFHEGLIESGWATFTVIAIDDSGLESKPVSKEYWIDVPKDSLAPNIVTGSSNLQAIDPDTTNVVDKTIARKGTQTYLINYNEQVESVDYTFNYGSGFSHYDLETGLNSETLEDPVLWQSSTRVIQTNGDGTDNGYRYTMNKAVNSDSAKFSVDLKMTGSFYIFLRVYNDAGIVYMRYSSSFITGEPYVSNGYMYMPLDGTILNNGEWCIFSRDIQADFHKVYPNNSVSTIYQFLIRGSAKIDNIMVDNSMVENCEDGDTSSWDIYDQTPEGATLINVNEEQPQFIEKSYSNSITNTYSNGLLMSMTNSITLDTTLLSDGDYVLTSSICDMHGNLAGSQFWLRIDNTKPSTPSGFDIDFSHLESVWVNPTGDDTLDPNNLPYRVTTYYYAFSWGSSIDSLGLKEYKVYFDGTYLGTTTATSVEFEVEESNDFLGTWKVEAIDYAGNVASGTYSVNSVPDSDNDGLNDFSELNTYGTLPNDSDTDNDGLSDGAEVNTYSTNPKDSDSDNDGLNDYQEEVTYNTDANDSDTDNDGLNDYKEVKVYFTYPRDSDTDNDGLSDGAEVNTYSTNPKDSDSDNDGLNDYQEEVTYNTDANDSDTDNDGLNDYKEVKVYFTYPRDSDTDNDGLSDGAEVNTYRTNPKDSDSDNDGLSDGIEVNSLHTDPNDSDSDNDGYSDYDEFIAATDPNDPNSKPGRIIIIPGGGFF